VAYYQAKKNLRIHQRVALTLLQTLSAEPAKSDAAAQKLDAARVKYRADAEKNQADANAKDDDTKLEERRALRFDIARIPGARAGAVLLYFLARKGFFPIFACSRAWPAQRWPCGAGGLRKVALRILAAGARWGSRRGDLCDALAAGEALRVEARSADLLAVALVHDDRMVIHLSRVSTTHRCGSTLTVMLRGAAHSTVAESDGSYTLQNTGS